MAERPWQRLTAPAAREWLAQHPNALLLDARDAAEHELACIAGSVQLGRANHEALLMASPRRRPVLIYCRHGESSQTWAQMFADFGFSEVADLIGGWHGLDPAGSLRGTQNPDELLR